MFSKTDFHTNVDLPKESAVPLNMSPIFSLPADILLEIFQVNANMDRDELSPNTFLSVTKDNFRAINTTRISSQVCSLWRDLIINAPLLWASLIDLDFLQRTGHIWRAEVVKRAQSTLLHVKGNISFEEDEYNPSQPPWWQDFLNLSWPRILDLDLGVFFARNYRNPSEHPDVVKGLSFLSQPAPDLQSFHMYLENPCEPLVERGSLLFDDHVPQLRFFRIKNVQFTNEYPWLSQLRNLHIYRRDGNILTSVDVLYAVLSRMPHLESLYVEAVISSEYIAPDRLPIHFSQLKYIQLQSQTHTILSINQDNKSAVWALLNYIIPKTGCSIHLILDVPPSDELDPNPISRLARDYFHLNRTTYLEIEIHSEYFTFNDSKGIGYKLFDQSISEFPFFNLMFDLYHPNRLLIQPTDQRVCRLFKELLFLSFPEVTELELTVRSDHAGFFTDHQFGRFLSTFTALKKLATFTETLQLLCTSTAIDLCTVFPLLDNLQIAVEEPRSKAPPLEPLPKTLVSFLRLRREAGLLILTFEYRGASLSILSKAPKPLVEDLSSLEALTGLNVVWDLRDIGSGHYVCGSGISENLNFVEECKRIIQSELRG